MRVTTKLFAFLLVLPPLGVLAKSKTSGSDLKQEMSFQDTHVKGKYQYADEAIAAVEDEKVLDNLLKVRTDFKDRLKKETKRR
jgi:hypothetical protein